MTTKKRTNREPLTGDYSDKAFGTSLDWPADTYTLVKLLAKRRRASLNSITVLAVNDYLKRQPELSDLLGSQPSG